MIWSYYVGLTMVLAVVGFARTSQAADFPYSFKGDVYFEEDAISPAGELQKEKVLIGIAPSGVSPKQLDVFATLTATSGAETQDIGVVSCGVGEVASGQTIMYRGVSCNWPTAGIKVPKGAAVRAKISVAFEPLTETTRLRSSTGVKRESVAEYPKSLPANCAAATNPIAKPVVRSRRLTANVYQLPNAVDAAGLVNPSKICFVVSTQGPDVNTVTMFATLTAMSGTTEHLVGTATCEFVGASVKPIPSGSRLIYQMASCNFAPTRMFVPKGARLRSAVGLTFGSAQRMSVSEGPVKNYPLSSGK